VRESHHGRAFAVHTFGGSIGYALAPVVMVGLAAVLGWQGALIVAGAAGIAMALAVFAVGGALRDDAGERRKKDAAAGAGPQPKRSAWRIMLTRPMILFFLFYVATSGSGTGMTNFMAVALPVVYGMTPDLANTILSVFLVAAIAGSLPGGWLADWARREDMVIAWSFVAMALCLGIVGLGGLSLWPVAGLMIVAGFMRGLYNASRDILVRRAAPSGSIGAAFGFVTLGYTLGQGGTPVIYGWLLDHGMGQSVFFVSAGFALLAIVTVLAPTARKS
jgi:nitrate/nitrite transporter NarK